MADSRRAKAFTDDKFWSDHWKEYASRRLLPAGVERALHLAASRHYRHLFRKLVQVAGCPSGSLLEIGCAPGSVLEKVHEACPSLQLYGIDFSASGLETTRQRLRNHGVEATLYQGDAFEASLPLLFDLVLSVGVIEHFDDPLPMVESHIRLCKPGGYVVILVPYFTPIPRFFFERFDPEFLAVHNLDTLKLPRLKEIMGCAGLKDVQAGKFGPPLIWATSSPSKRFGGIYRRCAWCWNQSVSIFPFPPLWRTSLYAMGRVSQDSIPAVGAR